MNCKCLLLRQKREDENVSQILGDESAACGGISPEQEGQSLLCV